MKAINARTRMLWKRYPQDVTTNIEKKLKKIRIFPDALKKVLIGMYTKQGKQKKNVPI